MEGTSQTNVQESEIGPHTFTINTKTAGDAIDFVQEVIKLNGWKETTTDGEGDMFFNYMTPFDQYFPLLESRRDLICSRIPLLSIIAYKSTLAEILIYMNKFYRDEFNFIPKTYILPDNHEECKKDMNDNPGKMWILKPSTRGCGLGIILVNDYNEVVEATKEGVYVLQPYIERPLLIDNRKFDLRIYVVLYGVDEMYAYMCEEGFARICSCEYEDPNESNKSNIFMHLTNYAINKENNEIDKQEKVDSKLEMKIKVSELYRRIESESTNGGAIVSRLKNQIGNICTKTVKAIHGAILQKAEQAVELNCSYFHIIGFDIMIDKDYNTWLIEINSKPIMGFFKPASNQDQEIEITQVDIDVKLLLFTDVLPLAEIFRRDPWSLQNINTYNNLTKIYSNCASKPEPEFNALNNAKIIYDAAAGAKGEKCISVEQFTSLYRKVEILNKGMLEVDLCVIYESIAGRTEPIMNFKNFRNALYHIYLKFKSTSPEKESEDTLDSQFPEFLNMVVSQLS